MIKPITKQELLEQIQQMPDDIEVFITGEGRYNEIDIKVFLRHKSDEFYKLYFGM